MFPIEKSTMTTEVATPNRIPLSRELLTTMTECPGCGAAMQYRSLAYKHCCPKPVSETERAAEPLWPPCVPPPSWHGTTPGLAAERTRTAPTTTELGTLIPPLQLAAEEPAAKEVPPTWAQKLDISFSPAIKEGVITPPGRW